MSVLGGEMAVVTPNGYCLDRQTLRQQDDGAVVLIGRCDGGSQLPPAVISVTIGVAGSAGVIADGGEALADYFGTVGGRAALSTSGNADNVTITQTARAEDVFAFRITEVGIGDYWRAVLGLAGRLVTVSVQGPESMSLDAAIGRQLLGQTVSAMRSANASR